MKSLLVWLCYLAIIITLGCARAHHPVTLVPLEDGAIEHRDKLQESLDSYIVAMKSQDWPQVYSHLLSAHHPKGDESLNKLNREFMMRKDIWWAGKVLIAYSPLPVHKYLSYIYDKEPAIYCIDLVGNAVFDNNISHQYICHAYYVDDAWYFSELFPYDVHLMLSDCRTFEGK